MSPPLSPRAPVGNKASCPRKVTTAFLDFDFCSDFSPLFKALFNKFLCEGLGTTHEALDDKHLELLGEKLITVCSGMRLAVEELETMQKKVKTERLLRECRNAVEEQNKDFVCPISYSLMRDPVIASDGHSYERGSITKLLNNHSGDGCHTPSPFTRKSLNNSLLENITLKKAIGTAMDREMSERKRQRTV